MKLVKVKIKVKVPVLAAIHAINTGTLTLTSFPKRQDLILRVL